MTSEEMERAIEFLLRSQAKHDTQIAELRDQVAETNRIVQMHADTQSEFIQIVTRTLEALGESQRRTDERLAQIAEAAARSEERNAHRYDELDARLDRLVSVVERLAERA
jgi:peptidoglycan hydrolase CwlO-like protein